MEEENLEQMRPSLRSLITSIYANQRVLVSSILKIDKLFREYNTFKKEIDYLSIQEYFDSVVQVIRYEIAKVTTKFFKEKLCFELSTKTENPKEFRNQSKRELKKVKRRYDEMTKGFFMSKKDLKIDIEHFAQELQGVTQRVNQPVIQSDYSSIKYPSDQNLPNLDIDTDLGAMLERGNMRPLTRKDLKIGGKSPFSEGEALQPYYKDQETSQELEQKKRNKIKFPIRAKFKSDEGENNSEEEEEEIFDQLNSRERSKEGPTRSSPPDHRHISASKGVEYGTLPLPVNIKGMKLKLQKYESGIENASHISPISKDRGVMMTSKPPKLYEYFIKGINALSKEIDFIGWEECADFIHFPSINLSICCIKTSPNIAQIYTLETKEYTTISTGLEIPLSDECLKLVKKQQLSLFMRTLKNEITLFFKVNDQLKTRILKIKAIDAEIITDFAPICMNQLILVSWDGNLEIHEFSAKEAVSGLISEEFKLPMKRGEKCQTVTFCPYGKFGVVNTIFVKQQMKIVSQLYLLKFEVSKLEILHSIDYTKTDYSLNDWSYFSSINLDFYHGDYPLIFAVQHNSQNLLFCYKIENNELEEYSQPIQLHNSPCLELMFYENVMTSVDQNGNLSRINFIPKKKLRKLQTDLPRQMTKVSNLYRSATGNLNKSRVSLKPLKVEDPELMKTLEIVKNAEVKEPSLSAEEMNRLSFLIKGRKADFITGGKKTTSSPSKKNKKKKLKKVKKNVKRSEDNPRGQN